MRWTARVPSLSLGFFVLLTAAPGTAQKVEQLEYTALVGAAEIGSETVQLTATGWTSKGAFDVLGTRKGSYTAKYERGADGKFTYNYERSSGGKKLALVAKNDGETFFVMVPGTTRKRSIPVKADATTVIYDDLHWACMSELGRVFAELEQAGRLKKGAAITALVGSAGVGLDVVHESSIITQQRVLGAMRPVRVSNFELAGRVGMTIVCTMAGVALKIEIPSQQLTVTAKGFEDLVGARKPPTSVVDSGPWRAKLSGPDSAYQIRKKVMIPMRDGVRLAADIYVPEGAGPFPAILARTPYQRSSEGALKGAYYARRGYVFVAQDVRGRFDSEGEWFPFVHEVKDGSDTIDWIASQDYTTDKVGMIGASYVGLVQWLAAKSGNAHLACIVPQVSPPDPQQNFPYEGGGFLLGAAWWAKVLESMKQGTDWRKGLNWAKMYGTLPLGDLDKALNLKEETFLDEWLKHPPHDVEFWDHAMYQDRFATLDVPAFHVSGWYDGDQPGAVQNYVGMRQGAKTAAARDAQYLVMGPWTHFFNASRKIGAVDFGDEAVVDLDARIVRFFDHYLKGVDNGIDREAKVHVFTMGTNRWHAEQDYPVPGTKFTKLYLASGGAAKTRDGDGRLGLEMASGAASNSYRYDPMQTPSLDRIDFTDVSGAYATSDHSVDEDREDDLEFTSPPLATDSELMGPVTAILHVATDAADTDFTVAVYRVSEKGEMFMVRGGMQRLRYAKSATADHPVKPGTVTRVEVDCWAVGLRLRKGERIRVVISSWAWPGYGRNLNTLESPLTATKGVVATNTVFHDAKRPSHLLLPVVPRADAPGLTFGK